MDPPPSSSRRGLHLNLCYRRGGLILPDRHLCHVDCYVTLSQAHDDVNLLQPSSTSKPPLPPPFPMDWMCIPGSGSSSGGGAILLVVLVLKAAARLPSTLPSMVGLVVVCPLHCPPPPPPLPLSDATPSLLSLRPSLSSPDNDDSGSSAGGWQGSSAQCARRQRTLAESPAPRQLSSPPAASDAPLDPRDIIGGRQRQRPRSVSVDFVVVVVERRGGEGDGRARDGRRQRPTMPAPSNNDKGVLVREHGLFAGGGSVLPHQGHDWSRSCPKSYHCAEFYMIWHKIYLGKRTNRDSGFTVSRASVAPVRL